MTDRPIIFSGPMVRALLAGRKTQTRRLLKPQPDPRTTECSISAFTRPCEWMGLGPSAAGGTSQWDQWRPLKFSPADRLYVREGLRETKSGWRYRADDTLISMDQDDPRVTPMLVWAHHKIDKYAPSIHMPRWASRLTLIIENLRIERLQSISEADAIAEGAKMEPIGVPLGFAEQFAWDHGQDTAPDYAGFVSARASFRHLWSGLHSKHGERWDDNPWIVAVSFSVVRGNIDRLGTPAP